MLLCARLAPAHKYQRTAPPGASGSVLDATMSSHWVPHKAGRQPCSVGHVHGHTGAKAAICTQAHSTRGDVWFSVACRLVSCR